MNIQAYNANITPRQRKTNQLKVFRIINLRLRMKKNGKK